jgi:hypothetical protein
MRQNKFRVWDKYHKQFLPLDVYNIVSLTSFNAFGVMRKDWMNYSEGEYFYESSQILEQFIGRQDNKLIDLYEGDIISDHVGIGVIRWSDRNNSFKVSYVGKNKGQGKWFADFNLKGELESIQKIGTIHQNPKMLEDVGCPL